MRRRDQTSLSVCDLARENIDAIMSPYVVIRNQPASIVEGDDSVRSRRGFGRRHRHFGRL